jgi:hypothetical protein
LVSRLEKNDKKADDLAKLLRDFIENTKLHIVLYGGKKLAELKAKNGALSILNMATVREYPQMTLTNLQFILNQESVKLSHKKTMQLLNICGGHEILLKYCIEFYHEKRKFSQYEELLEEKLQTEKSELNQIITQIKNSNDVIKINKICSYLNKVDIQPAEPYIFDDLLRELYWSNLLIKRGLRLEWRCEALCKVSRKILECEK